MIFVDNSREKTIDNKDLGTKSEATGFQLDFERDFQREIPLSKKA